ncbi:MAG: HVO_0476 family zinc finger protein [Methanobacteriales archaeon]
MKCPICGSESLRVVKSKTEYNSKYKKIKRLILECEDCGTTFKENLVISKPLEYPVIISQYEKSWRDKVKLYSDEEIAVGDTLSISGRLVEITSLELKNGKRVDKCRALDLATIWAIPLDAPARVGVSIDLHGKVFSRKLELDRNFTFRVGDIFKLEDHIFQVKSIKTTDRHIKRGAAPAHKIKRIYGSPTKGKYKFDLSENIISGS